MGEPGASALASRLSDSDSGVQACAGAALATMGTVRARSLRCLWILVSSPQSFVCRIWVTLPIRHAEKDIGPRVDRGSSAGSGDRTGVLQVGTAAMVARLSEDPDVAVVLAGIGCGASVLADCVACGGKGAWALRRRLWM